MLNPNLLERSRSHSVQLVNPPPLSTVVRPPFNGKLPNFIIHLTTFENANYIIFFIPAGYFDKRKKPKPPKPNKEENEEGASEEVGEEQEETSSVSNFSLVNKRILFLTQPSFSFRKGQEEKG